MPWDNTKSTEDGDGAVDQDEQLTAAEWNAHVDEGHFPSGELNFGVNVDGDPVVTDPQNGDAEVAKYDRSAGEWVMTIAGQAGALSDSGSDNTDGGDRYQLPQVEDSIDGQGGAELENFESVSTDSLNGGGVLSEGDGTERQIWVIANGASDPAGADPEDIIFEEEA